MAFFSANNPIALLLAGIIVFLVLRVVLSKALDKTDFGKKHADFVSAIIAVVGLLMITSLPFLKMVALSIPFIGLVFFLLCLGVFLFLAFGIDNEKRITKALKHVGKNVYMWILIVLIVIWGASLILGPELLEMGSGETPGETPITGFAQFQQEKADAYDFSFIFTKPVLGFIFAFLVIGMTFYTVTRVTSNG